MVQLAPLRCDLAQANDLIARFPILVAYAYHGMNYKYREKADLVIVRSDSRFHHAEDFMRMF